VAHFFLIRGFSPAQVVFTCEVGSGPRDEPMTEPMAHIPVGPFRTQQRPPPPPAARGPAAKLWLALVSYLDRRREVVVDVTEAVEAAAACFSDIPAKH